MKRTLTTLACALMLATTVHAQAQDIDPHTAAVEYENVAPPAVCSEENSVAGSGTGVALSSAGVLVGDVFVAAGATQTAYLGTGIALMGLSVAGLVASGIYLKRARKKRVTQHLSCHLSLAPLRQTTSYSQTPIIPGLRF